MTRLLLFDVDGTLTEPMKEISDDMISVLKTLQLRNYTLAVVGGSDYNKISKQLAKCLSIFEYIFAENGLMTYHNGKLLETQSILDYLSDENYSNLINNILSTLSVTDIPVKRGNFIELRNSCINVSPIGRSCSYDERVQFNQYDSIHSIRKNIIKNIQPILNQYSLESVIGGMISFDIYPKGWDKTYCLRYLDDYDEIYFFGDKTQPGGNDHSLFMSTRVIGHTVENYLHLIKLLWNVYFL